MGTFRGRQGGLVVAPGTTMGPWTSACEQGAGSIPAALGAVNASAGIASRAGLRSLSSPPPQGPAAGPNLHENAANRRSAPNCRRLRDAASTWRYRHLFSSLRGSPERWFWLEIRLSAGRSNWLAKPTSEIRGAQTRFPPRVVSPPRRTAQNSAWNPAGSAPTWLPRQIDPAQKPRRSTRDSTAFSTTCIFPPRSACPRPGGPSRKALPRRPALPPGRLPRSLAISCASASPVWISSDSLWLPP